MEENKSVFSILVPLDWGVGAIIRTKAIRSEPGNLPPFNSFASEPEYKALVDSGGDATMVSEELIIKLKLHDRDKISTAQKTAIFSTNDGSEVRPVYYVDIALITDYPTLQYYGIQHVEYQNSESAMPTPRITILFFVECLYKADLFFDQNDGHSRFIMRIENPDENKP